MARLIRHGRERRTGLLRLEHANRFPVHEQEVVALADGKRDFPQGDSFASGRVKRAVVLHRPPGPGDHPVDLYTGFLFGRHGGDPAEEAPGIVS
jgi:hypothetical protein